MLFLGKLHFLSISDLFKQAGFSQPRCIFDRFGCLAGEFASLEADKGRVDK
jgi:hypothetical protein